MNPRRAVRAPVRCRTAVSSPTGSFDAETEDIGARGCQVVSPRPVNRGDAVRVTIASDKVPEPLVVGGRVAWVSDHFPWHVGIAFEEEALSRTTEWVQRLVEASPGMRELRRLPERIPFEAVVYLGQPPRFVVDFSADEAALLRGIGSGARVDDLMARLRARGSGIERALFSLIARSAITLVRGQAVHPSAWKPVLDEVEAALAADALDAMGQAGLAAPPPAAAPDPAPAPTPAPAPVAPSAPSWPPAPARTYDGRPEVIPLGMGADDPFAARQAASVFDEGVRIEIEEPTGPGGERLDAWAASPSPAAASGEVPGGGRRRKTDPGRSGEAQGAFDRGRAELAAGNVSGAIALMRRALALAPGDSEIAEALGKLAFKDRDPDAR